MRKTRRGLCRKGNSRVRKGSRDARAEQATSQSKPGRLEMPPCANQHSPPPPTSALIQGVCTVAPCSPAALDASLLGWAPLGAAPQSLCGQLVAQGTLLGDG